MTHQSFVDWMKALGMLLIIGGHVVGDPFNMYNAISQPAYTKQLGVAFFVFVTGWSLANEQRVGARAVYYRIFPMYFYGILFAALLSAIYFSTGGDINESNYLPFIGGINVLFDNFPANPTTWYIGTYLHMLLFWLYIIRNRKITLSHIAISLVAENIIRCLILSFDKTYVAYMIFPNWMTIFLLGMYLYDKRDTKLSVSALMASMLWFIVLFVWWSHQETLSLDSSFPFRKPADGTFVAWILPSVLVSMIYLINTLVIFTLARNLPRLRVVGFFARNTLLTFIVHMPLLYLIYPYIYNLISEGWLKRLVLIVVLYVGMAVISEVIEKTVSVKLACDWSWRIIQRTIKEWIPNFLK